MTEARFANRVVMITGAGGGFGRAAAIRFAAEGARLALSDISKPALDATVDALPSGSRRHSEPFDITDESDMISHIEQAQKLLGPLDISINNAGIGQVPAPLAETAEAEFDRIMAVNAKGVFLGLKHQLPGMIARKRGVILNVASAAGLVGAGQLAAYAASKHAVIGLTRSAADEAARHNVRVNALCPSFAPTPLFNEMADEIAGRHQLDREAAYRRVTSRIPMRRLASVDEVVQAMLWACDPANSFMTGQAIGIDGGLTAV